MSDQSNKTISDKLRELDELARWFESEEFELEQALERFATAEELSKEIEKDLADFKHKVTVLKKDFSEAS